MYYVEKRITISAAHNLHLSYESKCEALHGHNFVVKAIAEQAGVNMPSFFGYMIKFSLVVLLPIYIVAQLIFL